jgi:hypothetical protein
MQRDTYDSDSAGTVVACVFCLVVTLPFSNVGDIAVFSLVRGV